LKKDNIKQRYKVVSQLCQQVWSLDYFIDLNITKHA
jgi:hypothetical protein